MPVVTLTSDFGAGSGYPAQMKGVLLRAIPGATLVDLSHDVPPYDVLAGALLLEAVAPWFPDDAVHCAVVDPGVGTERLAIVVVDVYGRRFVGPDNGLFTPFLGAGSRVHQVVHAIGAPERCSATFHGRDVFAPAAAWVAAGGDPARLGPAVATPVRLEWPTARREQDALHGECLTADPFGNVLTSIRDTDLSGALETVSVAGRPARFVRTFGDGRPGELLALIGSSGRLEIAIREGNAAREHRLGRGVPVVLTFRSQR